jgi:DNA-binding beta-propeller fold protein YncE
MACGGSSRTHWFGYDLALLKIDHDRMTITGRVEVGPEPRGVVLAQGGKTAFVAVGAANEVARVDLETMRVSARVAVGREPRGLALSPDGSILLVGNARSQRVYEKETVASFLVDSAVR